MDGEKKMDKLGDVIKDTMQVLKKNKSCSECKYYIRDMVQCNHQEYEGSPMAIYAIEQCPVGKW